MAEQSARTRILDAAERRARRGGYHGFSFRDLAADVGMKSSSVHYHFPTKADLTIALVARYAEGARRRLGDPEAAGAAAATRRMADLFRGALGSDAGMCLCGLLAAERDALPEAVSAEVAAYFHGLIGYLRKAYGPDWRGPAPESVVARLEGGVLLARVLCDPSAFEAALAELAELAPAPAPTSPPATAPETAAVSAPL